MNYFTKTVYWRPLVPNDESVDKTTNPYFKILAPHLLRKMKQSLVWFKKLICLSIPVDNGGGTEHFLVATVL